MRTTAWVLAVLAVGCASGRMERGVYPDTGPRAGDAGPTPGMDAGPAEDDAGTVDRDAGPTEPDAGPRPRDAGPPDAGRMCMDSDGDGHAALSCGGTDCNDTAAAISPDAMEVCDGTDNNCDRRVDDGFDCPLGAGAIPCMTTCGTSGMQACDSSCTRSACRAATETCNGCDDTGEGMIDEGCGAGPANDHCLSGVDVTAGGMYMGTTCGADNTLDLGTGAPGCSTPVTPGTADVFYLIRTRPAGSSYILTITPGFAIQFVPSGPSCSGNGGCGPYSDGTFSIGGGGGTTWYFAIEKSDGTCGPFTLTVSGA